MLPGMSQLFLSIPMTHFFSSFLYHRHPKLTIIKFQGRRRNLSCDLLVFYTYMFFYSFDSELDGALSDICCIILSSKLIDANPTVHRHCSHLKGLEEPIRPSLYPAVDMVIPNG